MNSLELAKVKAFYYTKVAELGSFEEASKLVEIKNWEGIWENLYAVIDSSEPLWECDEYRVKPETVIHPGGEYPNPCDDWKAMVGKPLYRPCLHIYDGEKSASAIYFHPITDEGTLISFAKLGIYHLSEENAIAHAKVIHQIRG